MDVNEGRYINAERRLLKHPDRFPQFTRIDEDLDRAEIRGEKSFTVVYQTHALACEGFGWKINRNSYRFVERLMIAYTRSQGWDFQVTKSKLIDPTPLTASSDPDTYAAEQKQRKKENGKIRTLQRLILGKSPSRKRSNNDHEGFAQTEGGMTADRASSSLSARRGSKSEVGRAMPRRLGGSNASLSTRMSDSDSESSREVNDIFDMHIFEEEEDD